MERVKVADTPKYIGQTITLQGWVGSKRDHGKITFIDLRDTTGIVQVVGVGKMGELTPESVVEITGNVVQRSERLINPNISTGKVEIQVESYQIINKSEELPIPIDTDGREINEEARLKYRYLDLRRDRLHKILKMRSEFTRALRESLYKKDFVEVETPLLTFPTQEGARDFVVPSRYHKGCFYALPQAPQQYKQLLMTAGVEKYFQVARCIRDEDLRADRGFEFTQLDLEMSFVSEEEVMSTVEATVKEAVRSVGREVAADPFPIFTYEEAIEKFGADKFDLRSAEEKESNTLAFAWVLRFPFFKKVDKGGWTFTHNPFSRPIDEHLDRHLKGENVDQILTSQYDLVCNGYEVGGGSLRAYTPEVLKATFKIMGYSEVETEESVGHMLKAFSLGTPPHGGIALGIDRLIMLLAGEESLKETIAFPMSSTGKISVMDGPRPIDNKHLQELSLKVID